MTVGPANSSAVLAGGPALQLAPASTGASGNDTNCDQPAPASGGPVRQTPGASDANADLMRRRNYFLNRAERLDGNIDDLRSLTRIVEAQSRGGE